MFYMFAGMMSFTQDSEVYNFITSWELITTPQNFVQGSFSIKSLKLWHKTRGDFFGLSSPLNLPTGVVGYFSIKPLLVNYCCKALHIRCFWGSLSRTYSITVSCLIQINKWGIALKLLLTQSKIMVWSFSAKDSWCTKRFSKLWVMNSRVNGTCGRGHWRSLFYETVKNVFLGNVDLTVRKCLVKWR